MIEFYTKPGCSQCTATAKYFDKNEIEYKTIDISKNKKAADMLKNKGYMQLPVIITPHDTWTGFRPDKISSIK